MPLPLDQRPGLIIRHGSAISRDLGILTRKHGLIGAVLVTMGADRMGVVSCGSNDAIGQAMEELGDKILVRLDDGDLDPST